MVRQLAESQRNEIEVRVNEAPTRLFVIIPTNGDCSGVELRDRHNFLKSRVKKRRMQRAVFDFRVKSVARMGEAEGGVWE